MNLLTLLVLIYQLMAGILQPKSPISLITGAASGIGQAIAIHASNLNHKLVLIDIDESSLKKTASLLKHNDALIYSIDVSDINQIKTIYKEIKSKFGGINYMFNNAGIFIEGRSWKVKPKLWSRIFDVNVLSIVNMLNVFLDDMIYCDEDCHVINTSSMAGLIVGGYLSPYTTSKHAVIGLSRSLYEEMNSSNHSVGVSVLCPGEVKTEIINNERNILGLKDDLLDRDKNTLEYKEFLANGVREGMEPIEVAKIVFEAIAHKKFWIFTHSDFKETYEGYANEIIEGMKI